MAFVWNPVGTLETRLADLLATVGLKAKGKPALSYQSHAWEILRPGAPCYMGPMGGVHGVFPDATWRPQCEQEKWPGRKVPPQAR